MKDLGTSLELANNYESPKITFCTKSSKQNTKSWTYMISNCRSWTELLLCCVPNFKSITEKLVFYINMRDVGIRNSFIKNIIIFKLSSMETDFHKMSNTTQLKSRFYHLPRRSVRVVFKPKGPSFSLVFNNNYLFNVLRFLYFRWDKIY